MTLFIKYRTALFLLFLAIGILTKTYLTQSQITLFLLLVPLFIATIKYPDLYFILFLPLGYFLTPDYSANPVLEKYSGRKVSAIGTIIKNPEKRENSTRLFIKLSSIKQGHRYTSLNATIVAYLEDNGQGLTYGDKVELTKIRLERISNFKNPGSFDIDQFYKRKNIFYTTYVKSNNIKHLGLEQGLNPFLYRINFLRTEFSRFVGTNTMYPESAIINALTVGDKSNIPNSIREIFSGLGIAHIFAISGLHVGAIAVGFYFLFKWVLKRSEYLLLTFQMPRIAAILTIVPVFIYTALAGFSISAVRAFIMVTIYLLSIVIGKDDFKLNTLFIAGLIILLINPNSVFELSFQLSFLSVFGIILIHSFYPFDTATGFEKIKTAVKTTLAATFITMPIIINTFGYLPVFSVPANLILIPFVEFIIVPLGLISLLMFKISAPVSLFFLEIDTYFISILLSLTDWIDRLGLAIISVPKLDFITTLFLMLSAGILLIGRQYKKVNYLLLPSLILTVVLVVNNYYKFHRDELEINILDSGRKNIVLINTPSSKSILINGGYSRKSKSDFIERSVVVPYLLHNNITKIDHLVLTSLDKSHIKGAVSLLKKIDVKNIWINGHKLKSDLWEQIYRKNIKLNKISKEEATLNIDGVSLSFLRPVNLTVYDSKRPLPLLMEIDYGNYIFHIGEEIESAIFNNRKSNLYFITDDQKLIYDSIINNYSPDTIVCRKCKEDILVINNIYETGSSGTVTVNIKNNKIKIKEYIEK